MKLNRNQSIVFTVVYFVITLLLRFMIEPYLMGYYWISIGIGLYFILLYWVLYQKQFLNFKEDVPENN
jgi:Flp pilus assembly protein TadB